MLSYVASAAKSVGSASGTIVSTFWRWVVSAFDQLRGDELVAGQDQRPRLALHDRVRVGAVVLAERVARRLDDDAERVEARLRWA